jgi:hypothetical protein
LCHWSSSWGPSLWRDMLWLRFQYVTEGWSLHRLGPLLVFAAADPRWGYIKVISIVEYLKLCELNLVLMSGGVVIIIFSFFSRRLATALSFLF